MDREQRIAALDELYSLLDQHRERTGGLRLLRECTGRMNWPETGVYVFFEPGELRADARTQRIVRVGTHALTEASATSLWDRLRTHRGTVGGAHPGTGNHRGSIFRLHVGSALIRREGWDGVASTWGRGRSAPADVRTSERDVERAVSDHLGAMGVLWLGVEDRLDRAVIERGLIALLSNHERPPVDPPSDDWLGRHAAHPGVRSSGLWNVDHVDRPPERGIVDRIARAVAM